MSDQQQSSNTLVILLGFALLIALGIIAVMAINNGKTAGPAAPPQNGESVTTTSSAQASPEMKKLMDEIKNTLATQTKTTADVKKDYEEYKNADAVRQAEIKKAYNDILDEKIKSLQDEIAKLQALLDDKENGLTDAERKEIEEAIEYLKELIKNMEENKNINPGDPRPAPPKPPKGNRIAGGYYQAIVDFYVVITAPLWGPIVGILKGLGLWSDEEDGVPEAVDAALGDAAKGNTEEGEKKLRAFAEANERYRAAKQEVEQKRDALKESITNSSGDLDPKLLPDTMTRPQYEAWLVYINEELGNNEPLQKQFLEKMEKVRRD